MSDLNWRNPRSSPPQGTFRSTPERSSAPVPRRDSPQEYPMLGQQQRGGKIERVFESDESATTTPKKPKKPEPLTIFGLPLKVVTVLSPINNEVVCTIRHGDKPPLQYKIQLDSNPPNLTLNDLVNNIFNKLAQILENEKTASVAYAIWYRDHRKKRAGSYDDQYVTRHACHLIIHSFMYFGDIKIEKIDMTDIVTFREGSSAPPKTPHFTMTLMGHENVDISLLALDMDNIIIDVNESYSLSLPVTREVGNLFHKAYDVFFNDLKRKSKSVGNIEEQQTKFKLLFKDPQNVKKRMAVDALKILERMYQRMGMSIHAYAVWFREEDDKRAATAYNEKQRYVDFLTRQMCNGILHSKFLLPADVEFYDINDGVPMTLGALFKELRL